MTYQNESNKTCTKQKQKKENTQRVSPSYRDVQGRGCVYNEQRPYVGRGFLVIHSFECVWGPFHCFLGRAADRERAQEAALLNLPAAVCRPAVHRSKPQSYLRPKHMPSYVQKIQNSKCKLREKTQKRRRTQSETCAYLTAGHARLCSLELVALLVDKACPAPLPELMRVLRILGNQTRDEELRTLKLAELRADHKAVCNLNVEVLVVPASKRKEGGEEQKTKR